jgi:mycothiol synthase
MPTELIAEEQIVVPDAPEIPGLIFRHFRGAEDFPAMAEVADAHSEAAGVDSVTTVEDMARDYANLKNSDPATDIVMIEINGKLVGYKRVGWWKEEVSGNYIYYHFTLLAPEVKGKGLDLPLYRHSENRLREIASTHPTGAVRLIEAGIADSEEALREMLLSEGYRPARTFHDMVRPNLDNIPDRPLPEGIDVRPATPEQFRKIWEAEVEAFKDHWGEGETEEGDYARWLNQPLMQPELWQVAWDADEVAGIIRNFINEKENEKYGRKRGYVENISTGRKWRKRGIAGALIARSFRLHKELGMTEAALGVDSENASGALRLYKSMGFEVIRSFTAYRKPLV